jgi:hypothetical protein
MKVYVVVEIEYISREYAYVGIHKVFKNEKDAEKYCKEKYLDIEYNIFEKELE